MEQLPKKENLFEQLRITEQLKSQIKMLRQAGLIDVLGYAHPGYTGMDGKIYTVPSLKDIQDRIKKKKELIELKMKQGLTKMLIIPAGISIEKIAEAYGERLKKHHKENKLSLLDNTLVPNFDQNEPVYRNTDINDSLLYNIKRFDQDNHGGISKMEFLKQEPSGFSILFIEDSEPKRENQGQIIADRNQLEANQTPEEYLNKILSDSQYQGEEGLTMEAAFIRAMTILEEKNTITNDWNDPNSALLYCVNTMTSGGFAPYFFWLRGFGQAFAVWDIPVLRDGGGGCASAVRV